MNTSTRNGPAAIVLVGFSGAGKSTIAGLIADRLGWRAVDTDALIEASAGRTISAIFADDGEAAFRAMEAATCREVAAMREVVVATGGGALLDAETRRAFETNAFVVCLAVSLETVQRRLADKRDRPLLGPDLRAMRALFERRRRFYGSFAHRVDADADDPSATAGAVLALYRSRSPG